ncbi:DUF3040 domain-containing protein [Corynebacterium yudongzhengii]|uniref:DUF3040 domain-containing protein n=1 Tax=Corynebacterium yudongzhengii TaxID=2080740 RepID=A0A2U1T796_9CORY|nr:DUF3040 domain-containing protein [Corynebacterium yudongzhengii]AWB81562.1 DUF3040 domain-containing protein [Corynebacterium yudongzhengii]PWC01867.1 DUF3040 domain-containing protein [Corynebacterium yudongzhengii]
MSLSEQEQKTLREIEQSLLADDPKFGSSVQSGDSMGLNGGGFSLRAFAIGVVGLVMLIAGVALAQNSLWFIALSIVGFLVMFGAGIWALRGSGGNSLPSGGAGRASRSPSAAQRANSGNGFGSKMEENFRRRFEGN